MHKKFFAGLSILMIVGLWTSVAAALQIVYPADGSYVHRSDYLIIKAGAEVDGLTLEIDGEVSDLIDISSPEYRAVFDDFLIVQPEFSFGGNKVAVVGYKGRRKIASTDSNFFLLAPSEMPPGGYSEFVMHTGEREQLCAACHNMSPTEAQLNLPSTDNPCASCHQRMLNHENVHGPAGAWQCSFCHDASSEPKYRPKSVNAELCTECHQDVVDQFSQNKYTHGPVEAGLCNVCHDSHASAYPSQVSRPINELCLACHEGVNEGKHVVQGVGGSAHPLSGFPDPSRQQRDLSCTGCHNPHGGNGKAYFQRGITSRFGLCQICHQK